MSGLSSFPVQLTCPIDGASLRRSAKEALSCENGHAFPVVDGVPVLLREDVDQTIGLAEYSLARARTGSSVGDAKRPELFLESLGVSEDEKRLAVEFAQTESHIDPVAAVLIGATNGIAYKHLIGRLREYPIPKIRLSDGGGRTLLDIGCSWGRWSIAARQKDYRVVGLDPSLGAIMAARRISRKMGLSIDFVCGDARYLPFASNSFDNVFSYSVIQHFSKADAAHAVREMSRVTNDGGIVLVQMPNRYGLRSQMHLAKRGYSEGTGFEVRYWTLPELERLFSQAVGPTDSSVHCFFGLGLEPSDLRLMPPHAKFFIFASEMLRYIAKTAPALRRVADSVYLRSIKVA